MTGIDDTANALRRLQRKQERTASRQRDALVAIVRYFDRFPGLTTPTSFHPLLEEARRAIEGGEGEKA